MISRDLFWGQIIVSIFSLGVSWLVALSGEAPTFLSAGIIPCDMAKSCNPLWDAKESEYEEGFALHWVQSGKAFWKMR